MVKKKRILIACDKFKGSISNSEIAQICQQTIQQLDPEITVHTVLVADGGDGTVPALLASGYTPQQTEVAGPTGKMHSVMYAVNKQSAILEMAAACGLALLPEGKLAPFDSSSYGLGQLIKNVILNDQEITQLIIGVGGSASTDGGAGMLVALGAKLLDPHGNQLTGSLATLDQADSLDLSPVWELLSHRPLQITLASDVDNPLFGPRGTVAVFGPQKGITSLNSDKAEKSLQNWHRLVAQACRRQFSAWEDPFEAAGAGAAGGVGYAALAVLGANMKPGIDLLLDLVHFDQLLEACDLVITGEGKLDQQTLHGKTIAGITKRAQEKQIPVRAICGVNTLTSAELSRLGLQRVSALTELNPDPGYCIANGKHLLPEAIKRLLSD